MKNLSTPLFIIAFLLISCKNEAEKQAPKAVVPFTQLANQQANQTAAVSQPGILYRQKGVNQNTAPQAQTQTAVTPTKVAKGMNPPHGQPGHRCDIAVGAPLNSPVTSKSTSPQIVSNSGMTVSSNPVGAVQTAKGMNPPHGQPGHRCDIAVGAPLNSPPAANKPTTPQVVPNYVVSPPASSETPAATPPAETTPPTTVPAQ